MMTLAVMLSVHGPMSIMQVFSWLMRAELGGLTVSTEHAVSQVQWSLCHPSSSLSQALAGQ